MCMCVYMYECLCMHVCTCKCAFISKSKLNFSLPIQKIDFLLYIEIKILKIPLIYKTFSLTRLKNSFKF